MREARFGSVSRNALDGETLLLGADHDEVVTAVEVAAPCAVNKATLLTLTRL